MRGQREIAHARSATRIGRVTIAKRSGRTARRRARKTTIRTTGGAGMSVRAGGAPLADCVVETAQLWHETDNPCAVRPRRSRAP